MTINDLRARLDHALLATDEHTTDRLDALIRHDPDVAAHLPDVAALDMGTGNGRHKELVDHTAAVTAKVTPTIRLRLVGLFHDVGKPTTRKIRGGTVTFHQHEEVGAHITRRVLRTLHYPDRLVDEVVTMVAMSGRFKDSDSWSDSAVRRFATDAGDTLDDLLEFCAADVTSRHTWKHERQHEQVAALRARIGQVQAADQAAAERPDLSGDDIMVVLNIPPGPLVGQARTMLLDHRRAHGPLDRDAAVALLHHWYATRRDGR